MLNQQKGLFALLLVKTGDCYTASAGSSNQVQSSEYIMSTSSL